MSRSFIYLSLIVIMMIWGLNVIALKILVEHFSPVTLTSFRILTAGIVVILILFFTGQLRKLTRKEVIYIGTAALFSVVAHHLFLAVGLTKTTASNAGLILALVPLVTSVLAVVFLGNRFTVFRFVGILLGFTGVMFVVLNGKTGIHHVSIGDFYIFLSVLSQAISFIIIKKATDTMDSKVMTGWMLLFGSLLLFFISLWMEPDGLSSLANGTTFLWMIFLASAVLATALGHMLYNRAIKQIGAAESAIFINLNPLFSLLGAYFFLGESISLSQIMGFILIVIGVILGSDFLDDSGVPSQRSKVLGK
ncbi:EamA/RhaT family transporter [Bacillus methanolicus]|uniref:DMT family transporter n=1 Tax=Bacillus methanolicus TaxID=1471 RepID=UPI00200F5C33|nr:DMT family transporter [Bacillus methanolicus]UQD52076.1 EamA/RhaT family transporter [Bacillus methanolicus]